MNVSSFIAQRIAFTNQRTFSRFIIRLATAATALSVAAMILTLAFVNGFQSAVSNKVFSFWGHLHIQEYERGKAMIAEEMPLMQNDTVLQVLNTTKGIKHIQPFATKSAVLEKNKEIEGILFKGVDAHYDFSNMQSFLVAGSWIDFNDTLYSKQIMVSKFIADELQINVNDSINIYFISSENKSSSTRRLQVKGIFKSGIEEFDKTFAIGDIRLLRRVNNWQFDEIGGYEVFLDDYKNIEAVNDALYDGPSQLPGTWISRSIKEIYPFIFDWLNIQDVNRNVIFIVMSIIAIINLITCLLILVLERTRMVGVLKAVGSDDWNIQKIFLYHASIISAKGIGFGLLFGVGIALIEKYTGFIKLDEAAYYVSSAPVEIIWWQVVLVCLGTLFVCFLSLLLPTLFVRTIKPVKAIQFR
ncbi:ABC transporter permease [Panacibacter ginsenosidivorans]|uniref:ABC transporter permease n=1 Tax=Panacibacter ginsenosidivorans TaxID=1813871 RepID=A0A5B8V4W7_9BACT|nr:FtsX-like permease family protein [Panacibacter ginsenosidivorans]QEC66527.1 ABC transporter permease [Panacibacter ginsenosidivorans]